MRPDVQMAAAEGADYPQLFRNMIVRSVQAALASIDSEATSLADEVRERCLYALSLALDYPEAWPSTQTLLIMLAPYLRWLGYRDEWMPYLEKGIDAAKQQGDIATLAKLHHQLGWLYRQMNLWAQAREHAQRAYDLAQQQNDTSIQIDTLDQLAAAAVERSDFTTAKAYIEEVFRLTAADDPRRAFMCSCHGYIAMQQGEWDSAIKWYSESVRLHTVAGQHRLAAQSEQGLAFTYTYTKDYQQSLAHYQHVLAILSQYPSTLDTAMTQMEMGWLYWLMGDYEQSLAMYQLCEPVFVKTENKLWLSHLFNNLGLTYMRIDRFEQAERSFQVSIALARELGLPRLVANAMESMGRMYSEMGLLERALATWEQGLAELALLSDPPHYLYNLIVRRIGDVKNNQGNLAPSSPASTAA